jgi:bacteriocin biosynthesis cyclodehydratase domain-containing protein
MLVLTAGAFGEAVAARLQAVTEVESHPLVDAVDRLPGLLDAHAFVAVALWRPYASLARRLDDLCAQARRRWSLVEVEGSMLSCGPLVVPGTGSGCYHCREARALAQQRAPERARTIANAYRRDDALGPVGYTQPMVEVAAGALLADAGAPETAAGRIRRLDVLTGAVRESVIIPMHDCPRCRPLPAGYDPTRRSLEALLPALQEVLA